MGPTIGQSHLLQREHLVSGHVARMEKILQANNHKSKYWVMGTAKCKRKNGRTRITPHLQVWDEIPPVTKESYLYEIDNAAGTQTLLWVMHPNNKLALPTLDKKLSVAG
jgi:hypothetical protein